MAYGWKSGFQEYGLVERVPERDDEERWQDDDEERDEEEVRAEDERRQMTNRRRAPRCTAPALFQHSYF